MKKLFKSALAVFLILALCILFLVGVIISFAVTTKPKESDCIIVLGCRVNGVVPSSFLQGRVDEGLRLYNEGYAKYIIVSGGQGKGEDISEAEAMKRYLVKKGVEEKRIIIEDKSTSTMENISNSKKKMEENDLRSAIIVSNSFHLKRASLMVKKVGIDGSYSGVIIKNHIFDEIACSLRETLALVKFTILSK